MPRDYFEPFITKPMAQLRLIHYPSTKTEEAMGIGPHTDYEPFTILWQDAAGLQVQNRRGQWIEAPPIPGTFVVNIGDMLQRWTNDLFVGIKFHENHEMMEDLILKIAAQDAS